jgi:hypothetical protein
MTEELFEKIPGMRVFNRPSLDMRQNILASKIPKLRAAAV